MNLGTIVLATLPFLPSEESTLTTRNSNPFNLYAQATSNQIAEDLTTRLMEEADSILKNNPKNYVAAIPLYQRIIAEDSDLKEEAIEKLGNLYFNRIFEKKSADPWIIRTGLNFYDSVIDNHKESEYLPKAKLYSGFIRVYFMEQDDEKRQGFELMKEAYKSAKSKKHSATRFEAAWFLGRIGFEYTMVGMDFITPKETIGYLKYVKKRASKDPYINQIDTMIQKLEKNLR